MVLYCGTPQCGKNVLDAVERDGSFSDHEVLCLGNTLEFLLNQSGVGHWMQSRGEFACGTRGDKLLKPV
jgi:hypothetical protein